MMAASCKQYTLLLGVNNCEVIQIYQRRSTVSVVKIFMYALMISIVFLNEFNCCERTAAPSLCDRAMLPAKSGSVHSEMTFCKNVMQNYDLPEPVSPLMIQVDCRLVSLLRGYHPVCI
jgi:hypothetical protein